MGGIRRGQHEEDIGIDEGALPSAPCVCLYLTHKEERGTCDQMDHGSRREELRGETEYCVKQEARVSLDPLLVSSHSDVENPESSNAWVTWAWTLGSLSHIISNHRICQDVGGSSRRTTNLLLIAVRAILLIVFRIAESLCD